MVARVDIEAPIHLLDVLVEILWPEHLLAVDTQRGARHTGLLVVAVAHTQTQLPGLPGRKHGARDVGRPRGPIDTQSLQHRAVATRVDGRTRSEERRVGKARSAREPTQKI